MRVSEIHDPHMWDSFVQAHAKDSGFLQSWSWGEFQKSVGRALWRLGVFGQHDNTLKGVALLTHHRMPLGFSYLYAPRGPIMAVQGVEDMRVLDALTEYLHETSLYASHIFVRFDAPIPETAGSCSSLQHLGFRHAPSEMQPKSTLIIDLTKSEEQLLAEMHQKTRYNIRLAEKKGVWVYPSPDVPTSPTGLNPLPQGEREKKEGESFSPRLSLDGRGYPAGQCEGSFDVFWSLLQETAQRDGFRTHQRSYYKALLQMGTELRIHANITNADGIRNIRNDSPFGSFQTPSTELFVAQHNGKVLAAALVAFYNGWALYLHGASSSEHRDFMAPHLLHWRIMQEAKRRGCTKYDLWGADIAKWPGVTRFKQGFAEETPITHYCGAWDYPLRPTRYSWYALLSHFRRRLSL